MLITISILIESLDLVMKVAENWIFPVVFVILYSVVY